MNELSLNKCAFKKSYAGVGTRNISGSTSEGNSYISTCLALLGYKVVSGHAPGSDVSFEIGAYIALKIIRGSADLMGIFGDVQIEDLICSYVPWVGFNGHREQKYLHVIELDKGSDTYQLAKRAFATYRTNSLDTCKESVQQLMHRNVFQVHGDGINSGKISFLIACTEDGANSIHTIMESTGGTSLAIALADLAGVAVLNNQFADHKDRICSTLSQVESLYMSSTGRNLKADFHAQYEAILSSVPRMELSIESMVNHRIDVVIHELNERLELMDDVGRQLTREYPSLVDAINETLTKDRVLGKCIRTVIKMAHGPVTVVSAITHAAKETPTSWPPAISYDALRKVLKDVKKRDRQRKVAMCDPGAESGRACRMTTKTIIDAELRGFEYFKLDKAT